MTRYSTIDIVDGIPGHAITDGGRINFGESRDPGGADGLRGDPNYDSQWAAINAVAQQLGVDTAETVREWVRQAEVDAGQRAEITTDESAESDGCVALVLGVVDRVPWLAGEHAQLAMIVDAVAEPLPADVCSVAQAASRDPFHVINRRPTF